MRLILIGLIFGLLIGALERVDDLAQLPQLTASLELAFAASVILGFFLIYDELWG